MIRIKIIIPIIFLVNGAFAQISNMTDVANMSPIKAASYDRVEGSPYYGSGDWYSGLIVTQTDQFLTDLKVRYNAYDDQLEYLNNGVPYFYDNQMIKSFEYSDVDSKGKLERYFFKNGFSYEDKVEKINFLRVIFEGDNLVLLNQVRVVKQKVTPANYGASDFDKFFDNSQAYLSRDGKLEKFKINRGSTLKAFPSLKKEIKAYIDDKLIDFDRVNDLVDLFKFIDSNL